MFAGRARSLSRRTFRLALSNVEDRIRSCRGGCIDGLVLSNAFLSHVRVVDGIFEVVGTMDDARTARPRPSYEAP